MECRSTSNRFTLAGVRATFWLLAAAGFVLFRAAAYAAAPPTPANIKVTVSGAGSGALYIAWSASSGATSYTLNRKIGSGTPSSYVTGLSATSYTDTGLTNGTAVYYTVQAVNGSGSSAATIKVGATPTSGSNPTAAPAYVYVQPQSSSLTVSWAYITNISAYNIYRSTSAGNIPSTACPIATQVTSSSWTDTTVTPGTNYYYSVAGVDTSSTPAGEGVLFNPPVLGNTSASVPTAAPVLTVQGSTRSSNTITLSWTSVSGASGGFAIFRGTSMSKEYIDSVDPSTLTYTDTPAVGTVYYYSVAGIGSSGDIGPASNTATGVRLNQPSLNVPTTGAGETNLSWNATTGAAGYNIYRSTVSGQETNQAAIATTIGNSSTSYTDATASGNVTYYYEVTSEDVGDGNAESKVSNEESATPPDFSISASPASVTVAQGNQVTSTITLTVLGTTSDTVSLSASGLPSGVTYGFSPASVTSSSATSTLTLSASSTATTGGPVNVTVTGTDQADNITRSTTVQLTVNPGGTFTVTVSPTSVSAAPNSIATATVTVTPQTGFSGSVSLSSTFTGATPTGAQVAIYPSSVNAVYGQPAPTATMAVYTAANAVTNTTYPMQITGTNGSQSPNASFNLQLQGSANQPLGFILQSIGNVPSDPNSPADGSVDLTFSMAYSGSGTTGITVITSTQLPPWDWYLGVPGQSYGLQTTYTFHPPGQGNPSYQVSGMDVNFTVPATVGQTLYYSVDEHWTNYAGGYDWLGSILLTPAVLAANADQTVDSRQDPRYSVATNLDHNFGTTSFRGGLFVGNMPLNPSTGVTDHSKVSRSYVNFTGVPALPTSPANETILDGSLGVFFVGAMAASPSGGFAPATALLADSSFNAATMTWDTQPGGTGVPVALYTGSIAYVPTGFTPAWVQFPIQASGSNPNPLMTYVGTPSIPAGSPFDVELFDANETADQNNNVVSWMYFDKLEFSVSDAPSLLYAYGVGSQYLFGD